MPPCRTGGGRGLRADGTCPRRCALSSGYSAELSETSRTGAAAPSLAPVAQHGPRKPGDAPGLATEARMGATPRGRGRGCHVAETLPDRKDSPLTASMLRRPRAGETRGPGPVF